MESEKSTESTELLRSIERSKTRHNLMELGDNDTVQKGLLVQTEGPNTLLRIKKIEEMQNLKSMLDSKEACISK